MYSVSPNIKKESHTNQTYLSNITVGDKHAVATWVVLRTERSYFQKLIMLQAHESWLWHFKTSWDLKQNEGL
jgi:hypothetical protein